jgi:hypothetical protein
MASIAPVSDTLLEPLGFNHLIRIIAGFQHEGEHILGNTARNRAIADAVNQLSLADPV